MGDLTDITRHLSFRIHDFLPGDAGCLVGRVCGDGIRLGDCFTVEYRVVVHQEEDALWSELIPVRCIALKVVRLEMFNRELEEIPSGYTCAMWFEGDVSGMGTEALIGDVLTRALHDAELERWGRLRVDG